MKFEFTKSFNTENSFFPEWNFYYSITEDEIKKVLHKYSILLDRFYINQHFTDPKTSLAILNQVVVDNDSVNLGINYKEKYEEIVKLLDPYKLEDEMSPLTTLKMILKYHK